MISLKLDSQPFQPSQKSKHFQKKEENVKAKNLYHLNNSFDFKTNDVKTQFDRKEKKVLKVTTVYCSHYLKMFKDDYTELPTGCSQEQLDYITKTQKQSQLKENQTSSPSSSLTCASFKSTQSNKQNQMKRFNSNNSNKYNNNYNNYKNKQKKDFHSSNSSSNSRNTSSTSSVNHAQFTSRKKSNEIEILIPTSKPIPIHHPSLLSNSNECSSTDSSSSLSHSSSNEEFPDVIDKYKHLKDNEIDNEEDEELNEEIQSIMDQKRRASREKQIFFGKNTNEYQNYLSVIPKDERRVSDPQTPDIEASLSKRKWDRVVRRWRRSLHAFDNVNHQNQVELARALAFRLQNEHNPKKTMMVYSSLPYSSYLVDE